MPRFHGRVQGELAAIGIAVVGDGLGYQRVYALRGGPIVYIEMCAVGGECPTRTLMLDTHRLYPLGEDFARDAVIAAVIDGPFWWLAVLRYHMQGIGKRLLATAWIWGLADNPRHVEQTWRDVYALRWVASKLGKR